jgi:purine nucleoside phosphorylase
VSGISCVSNPAAGLSAEKISGQAVVEEMMRTANKLSAIVQKMFALMQARG